MLSIVLIRPGSTEFDSQRRIQGRLDVPLTEKGRQEVAAAICDLKEQGITALYVSPTEAAEQTGQAIAEALDLRPKTLEKLHNLDQGLWQGMLVDDVKTKQPRVYKQWQEHPENVCPPNGEMVGSACQRVEQVLARITKKHKQGVVAIVVPEPLASVFHSILADESLGDLWRPSKCGGWEVLIVPDQTLSKA